MVTNGDSAPPRKHVTGDQATAVTTATGAAAASSWLQERAGADGRWLPDAQELARLRRAAHGHPVTGWRAWFDPAAGYLAMPADGPGDLAVARDATSADARDFVADSLALGGMVWIRDVDDHPVSAIAGVEVIRRLAVLERVVGAPGSPDPDIRRFEPDRDLPALAKLLRDAYDGTPDGWGSRRIAAEIARDGFDPADIVVARSADAHGELDGAHWTMRRDEHTGEVHNLSVHPRARGRGLARRLLDGGLARLAAQGCDRVILWVDEANEPAMHLYEMAGFTTAWVDALVTLPPA